MKKFMKNIITILFVLVLLLMGYIDYLQNQALIAMSDTMVYQKEQIKLLHEQRKNQIDTNGLISNEINRILEFLQNPLNDVEYKK